MHMKCNTCKGHKTIKGLGALERKCPTCKGIGYLDKEPEVKVHQEESTVMKRRGRPSTKSKVE